MAGGSQSRSKKLKRLVTVQRHIEKMAENELASLTRQRSEISETIGNISVAIASMSPEHIPFTKLYAERMQRLTAKDRQLEGMQQVQEMRVMQERTKGDRLEDNMKEARELEDREKDDNAIYDLLEITLLPGKGKTY